jgi:hypothetical protein
MDTITSPTLHSFLNSNTQNTHQSNMLLDRILPEPKSRVGNFISQMGSAAINTLGGIGEQIVSINPQYQALLEMQMRVQQEMQLISLQSNIDKSKHETQMHVIRNVRAA